jgi:hypothetical protein
VTTAIEWRMDVYDDKHEPIFSLKLTPEVYRKFRTSDNKTGRSDRSHAEHIGDEARRED